MNCPTCGERMRVEVELTQTGCCGQERCYCDTPDVRAKFVCPDHTEWVLGKNWYIRNPKFCKQKPLSISELSNIDGFSRWLTGHYEPSPGCKVF